MSELTRLLPFLRWRHRVSAAALKADAIAGLTGALVVLPQGVAFAVIAGMPPEYGLYAGMVPAIIAAMFGSSWHLVSGPTTAASVILLSVLSARAAPGSAEYVQLALTLTFMVGAVQIAFGLLRLGAIVNFISHSVIVGFTAGAAILIAVSQLKHLLGVSIPREPHAYQVLFDIATHLREANPFTIVVGVATAAAGIAARRFLPRVPYLIVAMVAGALIALAIVRLAGGSVAIPMIGALPAAMPPLSSPLWSAEAFKALMPAAMAVTLFALTEAVSIARSLALKSGQKLDSDQEFVGQGMSNIFGSFFSGYVATGSFNRSAVNYEAGAQTPLAAVLAGLILMPVLLVAAPLAAWLPKAAVAGLLFLVAWSLLDFHHIGRILRTSGRETLVLATTFFSAILLDLEFAILLGVLLSLLIFLLDASRPHLHSRVPDPGSAGRHFTTDPALPECPQLKILRIDGSLFFGSVHHVQKLLAAFRKRHPEQKHLLVMAPGINRVDISGAEFLTGEARERRGDGGDLYLCRAKSAVLSFLRRGGYDKEIGERNLFAQKEEAIAEIFTRLDREVCRRCDKRIFLECRQLPPPENR
jgi:SulP family sulfate permease